MTFYTITSLIESYLSECLAGIKNNEHGKHGPCTVRSDIPEQGKWFIKKKKKGYLMRGIFKLLKLASILNLSFLFYNKSDLRFFRADFFSAES